MGVLDALGGFFGKPKIDQRYSQELFAAGKGNKDAMKAYGGSTSNAAYGNLLELLKSQGHVDPRMMNNELAGIQQGTQGVQMAQQGRAQGSGFQNSGVNNAITAAIGQAGVGRQADRRAQETNDAYGRNQQNLALFEQLMGGPSREYVGMGMQQRAMDKQREMEIAKIKLAILSSAASMGMGGGMGGGMSAGGGGGSYGQYNLGGGSYAA